jgi:hypothetical protein
MGIQMILYKGILDEGHCCATDSPIVEDRLFKLYIICTHGRHGQVQGRVQKPCLENLNSSNDRRSPLVCDCASNFVRADAEDHLLGWKVRWVVRQWQDPGDVDPGRCAKVSIFLSQ